MSLTACPVCSHAVTSDQHNCPQCNWTLLPMLGVTPDEANARLAKARADWAKRHGKAFHQGEPDIKKSPFETKEEYQERLKGYWRVGQGKLLADQYDLSTQQFPIALKQPVAWAEAYLRQLSSEAVFSVERFRAKSLYEQSKQYEVYAQLQPTASGIELDKFQLYISPTEQFVLTMLTPSIIANRYIDNLDGTITDTQTKLQWKRCSEGQTWNGSTCTGEANKYTWNEATQLISNFAGKSDWRLPTIKELNTLVCCSNGKVRQFKADGYDTIEHEGWRDCSSAIRDDYQILTINTQAFPATPSWAWSSSAFAYGSNDAWGVVFDVGYDGWGYKGDGLAVRLVRSQ